MGLIEKVKDALSRAEPEAPIVSEPTANMSEDWLEVSITQPAAEAVTCQIHFDREVSPSGTSLFETPHEAEGWPAVAALLAIPGVHSVIGKGDVLVVARRDDTSWPAVLDRVEDAIHAAFDSPLAAGRPLLKEASDEPRDATADADLRARVQTIIDEEINPAVADHGGVITLLDVAGTRIFIHMGGGCQGCAMSTATLKQGVETTLRARLPEAVEILDTTDHAAGENPFYQP